MLIKGLTNRQDAIDLNMQLQNNLALFTYPWRTREELDIEIDHIVNDDKQYEKKYLFSFQDGSEFLGWVMLYADDVEKFGKISFLSLKKYNEFYIDELMDYIDNNYSGYVFDCGLPMENEIMKGKMQGLGFKVIDACIDNRIIIGKEKHNDHGIEVLKKEEFDDYAIYHDKSYGVEMYWNSSRVKEEFNKFKILVLRDNGTIIASLFMMIQGEHDYEIFGFSNSSNLDDADIISNLLEAAMSLLKENDRLVCFTDAYSEVENAVIKKLKFEQNSSYIGLRKKI